MTLSEFEKISKDERLFYRMPKVLFTDPDFKDMTSDAKTLYMILLDRRGISEINGKDWRDEEGCIFIYFTIEEMMKLLNNGNKKINKLLMELEQHDLILRRHQGLGKPNKIYVFDLLRSDNSNWKPTKNKRKEKGEHYE